MENSFDQSVRNTERILAGLDAADRKLIAELALASWLETLAPEERLGALQAVLDQVRWRLEEGPE
jgi:hypothetical protein